MAIRTSPICQIRKEIVEHLLRIISPGDLVITLGAGDIWQVSDELVNRLKYRFRNVQIADSEVF